jgi:hypothetical protein
MQRRLIFFSWLGIRAEGPRGREPKNNYLKAIWTFQTRPRALADRLTTLRMRIATSDVARYGLRPWCSNDTSQRNLHQCRTNQKWRKIGNCFVDCWDYVAFRSLQRTAIFSTFSCCVPGCSNVLLPIISSFQPGFLALENSTWRIFCAPFMQWPAAKRVRRQDT